MVRGDADRPASEPDESAEALAKGTLRRLLAPSSTYVLTRFVLLRALGFVYFFAFLSLANQVEPLLGSKGLLPAASFLARVTQALAPLGESPFWRLPSLFWINASDAALVGFAWLGVALSLAVALGLTNALAMLVLWALYLSYTHVGQIFFGYGWEAQLCETGLLAAFLCPLDSVRPFPKTPPPRVVIWLFRWLTVRIYLGAGLIKLRGDPCWRDLTCLVYHYETQPIPSPLSWVWNAMPVVVHKAGVVVNHLVEVAAPFFAFGPRRARLVAGCLFVGFQFVLISSGNLSFLNWLTIVPALACFDDRALVRLVPGRVRGDAVLRAAATEASRAHRAFAFAFALLVAVLSLAPIENLLSSRQAMNRTYDPFDLVGSYGAFGAVGRERFEVILEGTRDAAPDETSTWLEYELPCKPGDLTRRPCFITPYHLRLDWQLWFAAFGRFEEQAWMVRLVDALLVGNKNVKRLLAKDPFPDAPPRFVRAKLYRYEMTHFGDGSRAWWKRSFVRDYLRPVSAGDPWLAALLARHGFGDAEEGP